MDEMAADIDERILILRTAAGKPSAGVDGEIAVAGIADRAIESREKEQAVHVGFDPGGAQPFERRLLAVEPKGVAVENEEGIVTEKRERLDDAAAGIEQSSPLIGDDDLGRRLAPCPGFDLFGQMVDIDNGAFAMRRAQAVEAIVDDCLAVHLDERLRQAVGERAHPHAEPG